MNASMTSEASGHHETVFEETEHLARVRELRHVNSMGVTASAVLHYWETHYLHVVLLVQVASVLQLVLLHWLSASMPAVDICSLLLVHSTVSAAVQQSRACCVVEDAQLLTPGAVVNFSIWLPKHSGLVDTICYTEPAGPDATLAQHSLTLAFQLCAEQASQLAAGLLVSCTGHPHPLPLRLKEFQTVALLSPTLLNLMPLFNWRCWSSLASTLALSPQVSAKP